MDKTKIWIFLFGIFLLFFPETNALSEIHHVTSRDVFFLKTKTGIKLAAHAGLIVDKDTKKGDVQVFLMTPAGKKIELYFWGPDQGGNKQVWYYDLDPTLINEESVGAGAFVGNYVFLAEDRKGKKLASFDDYLILYRDERGEEMPDFDEASISPKDGAVIEGDQVAFKWNSIKGASSYVLKIYKGPNFDIHKRILSQTTENLQENVPIKNFEKGQYFWRLEALHEAGGDVDNVVRFEKDGKEPSFILK